MRAVASTGNITYWRAVSAGLCANMVGVGLARFAYTPLIPALIAAHWFSPSAAGYLGAANLAGYVVGALLARPIALRAGATPGLRAMMAVAAAAFIACAFPLSFGWFFLWRFVSGVSGGVLMALAAPAVLPHVPPSQRGLAGGAIFTGVGMGIAASGTLVPPLVHAGLPAAWLGLGVLALVLTAASWCGWPRELERMARSGAPTPRHCVLVALYVEYGLNAVGLVPHMLFLVDFVARGLGHGLASGARYWVLFGVGAMLGPLANGRLADHIGFASAFRLALIIQVGCVALLAVSAEPWSLALSSFVIGAMVPGVVPLVLGRTHELIPDDPAQQLKAWGLCTVAFALGQVAAAYGFSFIFAQMDGGYRLLYALGATAFGLALIIDLAAATHATKRHPAMSG
ncbi:MAG: YbfB/YjiJ family MFS transporter [Alphaproteobacteria bacterium]|nr:YbfB/YjiJ family MFS transporter [Alphaproteobacteria bacterium]MBV9375167.1 YbfB/YjiJ family MFS transporter [Alphaproteobacteria bacterium]MBV9815469.1 YbfB/YjiJ family MFS transporter [Alphaproteobacteria bacterium]